MIIIIKIGGSLIEKNLNEVIQDISEIYRDENDEYSFVVVHGGGPQINAILKKMSKNPQFYETPSGFKTRHTNQETIEAAIMSLAGKNNKRIVEAFQINEVNAFGLTGVDGRTIEAVRKEKILVLLNGKRIIKRGEYSGRIKNVNLTIIKFLLENHYLPIVGSLAISTKGEILNVDGDRAASYIAEALESDILISLTDVDGIYRDYDKKEGFIHKINTQELKNLLPNLRGGIKKKAYASIEAMNMGVKKVIICSGLQKNPVKNALKKEAGTVITNG